MIPDHGQAEQETDRSRVERAAIWAQRARDLAQPFPVRPEGETLNLLGFSLMGSHYAVEVTYVCEIIYVKGITPVPRTPDFVVGVLNSHGRLLSVIDIHTWWGLPPAQLSPNSQIIVVALEGEQPDQNLELGLLVDEVTRVFPVFQESLMPVLTTQPHNVARFVRGIVLEAVTVLDLKTLLSDEQLIVQEEVN